MTKQLQPKGLTLTILSEIESGNYGESLGNTSQLKMITLGDGKHTYVSRNALGYSMRSQLVENGEQFPKLTQDKGGVIQYDPDTTIDDSIIVDLMGYMKTTAGSSANTRSAVLRLSPAIGLEPYMDDTDILTNLGFKNELIAQGNKDAQNSIANSEIAHGYSAYTLTIDLDQVGVDVNSDSELSMEERARRVNELLNVVKFLYRDIRGRRENLSPIFMIGGVFDTKNPVFHNRIKSDFNGGIKLNPLVDGVKLVASDNNEVLVGQIEGVLSNSDEITEELNATSTATVFEKLAEEVNNYYLG